MQASAILLKDSDLGSGPVFGTQVVMSCPLGIAPAPTPGFLKSRNHIVIQDVCISGVTCSPVHVPSIPVPTVDTSSQPGYLLCPQDCYVGPLASVCISFNATSTAAF